MLSLEFASIPSPEVTSAVPLPGGLLPQGDLLLEVSPRSFSSVFRATGGMLRRNLELLL